MNRSCKHTFRPDCEDLEGRQLLSASPSVTKLTAAVPNNSSSRAGTAQSTPDSLPTPSRTPSQTPSQTSSQYYTKWEPYPGHPGTSYCYYYYYSPEYYNYRYNTIITYSSSPDYSYYYNPYTYLYYGRYDYVTSQFSYAINPYKGATPMDQQYGTPGPLPNTPDGGTTPIMAPPCLRRRDHGSGRNRPGAVCGQDVRTPQFFRSEIAGVAAGLAPAVAAKRVEAMPITIIQEIRPATDRTVSSIERITSVSSHRPMGIEVPARLRPWPANRTNGWRYRPGFSR